MKRMAGIGFGTILFLFLIQTSLFAVGNPLKKGEKFPTFKLSVPEDVKHQEYLGIKGSNTFSISDIKAEVVILQVFHSG